MPPGYAQLLESPSVMHIQPMQIDTKNRGEQRCALSALPLTAARLALALHL
jgi:hypothetical protein